MYLIELSSMDPIERINTFVRSASERIARGGSREPWSANRSFPFERFAHKSSCICQLLLAVIIAKKDHGRMIRASWTFETPKIRVPFARAGIKFTEIWIAGHRVASFFNIGPSPSRGIGIRSNRESGPIPSLFIH